MNYSDKLALIREYKKQGGRGSYLSVLNAYAEGGDLPKYDGKGDSQLPVGVLNASILNNPWIQDTLSQNKEKGLPEVSLNKYKVQSGDTLSRIASINKTDLNSIKRLNPTIKDINRIFPGQEIITEKKFTSTVPKELDYRYKTPFELDKINTISNEQKINLYETTTPTSDFYVIEDKKDHVVKLMNNKGELIKQYDSVSGRNKGDALTVTYTDKNKKIKDGAGNLMTPSGMFRITSSGEYHGVPSFTRGKVSEDYDIPSSVHRREVPKDKNKCNTSNGCTGLSEQSLKDLQNYIGKNTRWYILPENENSGQFKITGTGLSFISNQPDKLFSEHSKGMRPVQIIPPEELRSNPNVTSAIQTIQSVKSKFVDKLKISSDTYDRLAVMALGIMGRESGYGDPGIRGEIGLLRDDIGAALGKNVSAGNYQLRENSVPKNMFKKVTGIDKLDYKDLKDNVTSTQAVLTTLYDIYKNIAPRYKNKYPEMSLDEITLAYYTNPQGVINPKESELRVPYAKSVLENASKFKLDYNINNS
jgi:LysM repeat protein